MNEFNDVFVSPVNPQRWRDNADLNTYINSKWPTTNFITDDNNINTFLRFFLTDNILNPEQKGIFYILVTKDFTAIEQGLYTRLLDKSSYVFAIEGYPDVYGIVNFRQSAKPAHSSINAIAQIQGETTLYPFYTNTAVDLALKHNHTLSGMRIITPPGMMRINYNSDVWVTAVTQVDAASQKTIYSLHYTKPITMPITVWNLFENTSTDSPTPYTFVYKYMYGVEQKNLNTIDIQCNNDAQCDWYKRLVKDLSDTMFYFRRQNIGVLKPTAIPVIDSLLKEFRNNLRQTDPPVPEDKIESIRLAFSKLISNAISGRIKRDGNYDNPTGQQIVDSRKIFIDTMTPYMSSSVLTELPPQAKNIVNSFIHQILMIVNANNIDELQSSIIFITGAQPSGPVGAFGVGHGGAIYNDSSVISKQGVNLYNNTFKSAPDYIEDTEYNQKITPTSIMSTMPTILLDKKKDNDNKYSIKPVSSVIAKGPLILTSKPKPNFTSFFGKYGFDMYIDESGGYVLKPLNTEQEYNTYLQKYNLNIQERPNLQRNVPSGTSGGKIKTRKSRIFKHKTRKIQKLRNKRYTRKKIKKPTKRKTRHNH
jgi:hypothetical protein